uniref:phage portal protein family protein n=1 Tax=Prosthecobacter sp. TaxID=1965333 RepID=UPI0037834CEA
AGVIPNGSQVFTHEAKAEGDVFGKKTQRHDSAIVLAATGGLLTMLAQSGSGTLAGGAHSDTWRDLVSGIAGEVSEAYQEQLDKLWIAEKFPNQPIGAYFELSFPEEKADRKATAETVKTCDEAGFETDEKWLSEEMAMPLKRKAAPPPPAVVPPVNPAPPVQPPLKNRFQGGPSSARDRAEATQLAETAIQDALDVTHETTAPLLPDIQALTDLAANDQATEADFIAMATKVEQLLPELFNKDGVDKLAKSIEAAMGTATALGARAAIRQRSTAKA